MKCITAKDMMCGLGISVPSNCDAAACKVNAVLRRHYLRMIGMETVKHAMGFSTGGELTIMTSDGHDIYKVHGVYVKLKDNCRDPNCFMDIPDCDECVDTKEMIIKPGYWDLSVGEFSVDCDEITINLGDDVESGHIVYSRGPKEIESIDDKICLDPLQIEALQAGFQRMEAETNKEFDLANYFETREFNAIQAIKKKEEILPYRIGLPKMPF